MFNSAGQKVKFFLRVLGTISLVCFAALVVPSAANKTEAKAISERPLTSYVRYATGINIYGSPKDWYTLATRYGYYLSDKPVTGGVLCLTGGAYGTNTAYGFVGVVFYYHDDGDYWNIGTRYSYPTESGNYSNHSYVKEQAFRVLKKDANVHYIYRASMNASPGSYYTRPEYQGPNSVGNQYMLAGGTTDVTVYSEKTYVKAYVGSGQVVRVLAKAEVGETLWVFVKTSDRKGYVYAKTYDGEKEQLRRFNPYSLEAHQMYYAKNYGDTILDLGYADYSKIAGTGAEVTITVKKGGDPMRLLPLQTITLQMADK